MGISVKVLRGGLPALYTFWHTQFEFCLITKTWSGSICHVDMSLYTCMMSNKYLLLYYTLLGCFTQTFTAIPLIQLVSNITRIAVALHSKCIYVNKFTVQQNIYIFYMRFQSLIAQANTEIYRGKATHHLHTPIINECDLIKNYARKPRFYYDRAIRGLH